MNRKQSPLNILKFLTYCTLCFILTVYTTNGQPDPKVNMVHSNVPMTDDHSSQNSADWSGTYRTILPCADCAGIKTEVRLYKNGIYQMMQQYLGKSAEVFIQRGKLNWLEKGNTFQFKIAEAGQYAYKFELDENAIWLLDKDGKRIKGDLADKYELEKTDNSEILGKTWTLKRIIGEDISPITYLKSEANLLMAAFSNKATAMGGCNIVQMNYHTDEEERTLEFSNMIRTRKSCPYIELEQSYINALRHVASYTVDTDDLKMHDKEGNLLLSFSYKYFD